MTLKRCETIKVGVHCKYDMGLRYIAKKVMKREDGTIPFDYMVVLPLYILCTWRMAGNGVSIVNWFPNLRKSYIL